MSSYVIVLGLYLDDVLEWKLPELPGILILCVLKHSLLEV